MFLYLAVVVLLSLAVIVLLYLAVVVLLYLAVVVLLYLAVVVLLCLAVVVLQNYYKYVIIPSALISTVLLHHTIHLNVREVEAYKTHLTPPHIIEVLEVPTTYY